MENQNYFVGLDIGTNSVGYAVTTEDYTLCKFRGEPMWGVTLFDEASSAVKRRGFRSARRRLDRRQQRVRLVRELFAKPIAEVDEDFFRRIKESYLFPKSDEDKVRLFGTYEAQKIYTEKYPTIHHLITKLMYNKDEQEHYDVRLVYIACAWLVAHRGHFLSEVDKDNVEAVTSLKTVYDKLVEFITTDGNHLPWMENIDIDAVSNALKSKDGVNKKTKEKDLSAALFGEGVKVPKEINDENQYNYYLVIKLLCGGKVQLKELFGKAGYAELDEKSVDLGFDDEKLEDVLQSIDENDAELIRRLKQIYDWSVLVDVLGDSKTISEAKVEVYNSHKRDLEDLKYFIRKYNPKKYSEVFRPEKNKNDAEKDKNNSEEDKNNSKKTKSNYVGYINSKTTKADFCKYILKLVESVTVNECDREKYDDMIRRLKDNSFMPKQVDGDNRVIPYQLYLFELKKILENAAKYLPFLQEKDEDGITVKDKVLSVFEFKIPYYVGPLKEYSNEKLNHWMVRKAEGDILPWNFEDKVDLDRSEEAFIKRMTNSCTYLPGEDVLPKCSLLYSAFEVLNEINNIKINGEHISVEIKQGIFNDVFMKYEKVTRKRISDYLKSNNYMSNGDEDTLSGLDITVKSSLKSFIKFKNLFNNGYLTRSDAENIINHATYSSDKARFSKWLKTNYHRLPEEDIKYLSSLQFKDFGRLSKKLLCDITDVNPETGEYMSVIRLMWETNNNFMQLMSDKFKLRERIAEEVKNYYEEKPKSISERLDDMSLSNPVKRPIIRSLDILSDIVKVQKHEPKMIFIEMARGGNADQKGKRTSSRLQQIRELYNRIEEDVRELDNIPELKKELDNFGEYADNRLQSDKLFLYFLQLGRCLYTRKRIDINSVISGDGNYNIEHIYPRSVVKDDSILNNEILVDSKVNGDKSDVYPIKKEIRENMNGYWLNLKNHKLLSDEKYKRLTRTKAFTDDERYEFINRQLVETRQSTKAIATLLKEIYPTAEVVYVKAGLVSDFRQQFKLPKSRDINDLHHAKDAYLNIVVGNVWHSKFSRQFWRSEDSHNAKPEVVFTHPVTCNGKTVWRGAADKDRIIKIAKKNSVHMTVYPFCRHSGQNGGFFDQNILPKAEGLVPVKKDRPTEIYGGYNKPTATFFILVKYFAGKKQDLVFMPVELLFADKFLSDENFRLEYTKKTLSEITNKSVERVEFPFGQRIIKINTMLLLNGLRVCITGKSGGGTKLGLSCITPFKTSFENEMYIKRLSSFAEKQKKNENIKVSERYDGITPQKNSELYDCFIEKLKIPPYIYRPNNFAKTLEDGRSKFLKLEPEKQVTLLLAVLGLFGQVKSVDLRDIGGSKNAGIAALSSSLSNWKKNYTDVRLIDQSASGLFEKISDVNLLTLI